LVTDKGVLTETPAILVFIAQSFPQARLAPLDDAFLFAQVQAFNSYLCSTLHVAHAHRMRGYRWADDAAAIAAMQRKVPESVAACYQLIEETMLREPWVMGDTYTICDPYLFTMAQWLEQDGVDPSRPKSHGPPAPDVRTAAGSKGDCRGTGLSPARQRAGPARSVSVQNRTHPHAAKTDLQPIFVCDEPATKH
jgi:glutathione S-transferase